MSRHSGTRRSLAAARRVAAAIGALAVLAAALTACSSSATSSGYAFTSATTLGSVVPVADRKKAQDVGGPLLTGAGRASLRQDAGHVVVVDFFASWCGPCQVETPLLNTMYEQQQPTGLKVLGFDTKDQHSTGATFVEQNKISFPIVYDEPGKALLQLGNLPSAGLPVTVLIDKHQRVAAVYLERFTAADLEPVLAKLNAES